MLVVAVLASAFAPNFEVLLALRALAGLGGGTMRPTSVGPVSDVISQAKRAQAIGGIASTLVLTSAISIPFVPVFADWCSLPGIGRCFPLIMSAWPLR